MSNDYPQSNTPPLMLASDARHARYQELQAALCVALNMHVHHDTAHAPIDRVAWDAYQRDEAAKRIRARMIRLMRSGIDDVPHAK